MALYQLIDMDTDRDYWSSMLQKAMNNVPVLVFVGSLLAYITWNVSSVLFRGVVMSTAITAAYLYMRNSSTSNATLSKLKTKVDGIRVSLFKDKT